MRKCRYFNPHHLHEVATADGLLQFFETKISTHTTCMRWRL